MTEEKSTEKAQKKESSRGVVARGASDTFLVILGIFVGMMFIGIVFVGMNMFKKPLSVTDSYGDKTHEVGATYEELILGPGLGDLEAGIVSITDEETGETVEVSADMSAASEEVSTGSESGSGSGSATTVAAAPVKTHGTWSMLYMNTEKFDIDDEDEDDDEEVELKLKDVCKSIYKQNPNVVTYCRETSKLRKTTAPSLGADKCNGGGSCRVGETCLLWNEKEEDDGDLKSYTAMYHCG